MPPKTRGTKTIKASKENVQVQNRNKSKASDNVKKAPRKALADKTNSASDDNITLPSKKPVPIKPSSNKNKKQNVDKQNAESPKQRRARRVPVRYIGNPLLTNLSNSNNEASLLEDSTPKKKVMVKRKAPSAKSSSPLSSPLLLKSAEKSLLKARPKRICRLPSKLDGHSISPSKYIPLQPVHASTPIASKGSKVQNNVSKDKINKTPVSAASKKLTKKVVKNKAKSLSDTNNNGKKQLQIDKCFEKQKILDNSNKANPKKIVKNSSFRVFDDIKKTLKRDSSKLDPYEFTFDPDEEPPPQKKKKKRVVKKNPPKPKTVVKGVYEKNLAKALAALKNTVKAADPSNKIEIPTVRPPPTIQVQNIENNINNKTNTVDKSLPCENNYHSVRVEDIALDLQDNSIDDGHNIDYSPVNSPHPTPQRAEPEKTPNKPVNNKDPLNLQADLSFFDDQPIASSSINMSVRHPLASPWRVEFGSLPIKWQANTYVKANMTPAVESSFINSSDPKKKHVYTNLVPDTNESLPQIVDQPSLKQASILSFIKEVAERSAKKKKKSTPVKANSLFEDITHTTLNMSPVKNISTDNSKNSEQSNVDTEKSSNDENRVEVSKTPNKKSPRKRMTFFGFDESEEQENISPTKKEKRVKALVPRSRAVLQEINSMKGPSRAVIPLTAKTVLNSDDLNKDFEDPKSAMEPPVFPDKVTTRSNTGTEINSVVEDADSQSVHLFEDMDLIHHYHQPPRKSYSKPKRVAFRQNSASDSDDSHEEQESSGVEDNLEDLSFKLPKEKSKRRKKKTLTKKQILSKKEEKEVETWAAGFNSMCEDIEEFDLVVE